MRSAAGPLTHTPLHLLPGPRVVIGNTRCAAIPTRQLGAVYTVGASNESQALSRITGWLLTVAAGLLALFVRTCQRAVQ